MDDYYCVAVPGTPTTRTASASSLPTPTTPSDTISDCADYWLVSTFVFPFYRSNDKANYISDDNRTTIAQTNGSSVSDLETWNPSLKSNCSGLSSDTYICVGVPSNDTSSSTTAGTTTDGSGQSSTSPVTATAITTSTSIATPSPVEVCKLQSDIVSPHSTNTKTDWNDKRLYTILQG